MGNSTVRPLLRISIVCCAVNLTVVMVIAPIKCGEGSGRTSYAARWGGNLENVYVRAAAIEAVDAIAVIVEGFMDAIVERTVAAVLTNALTVERTILHVFGFH
jgi:hypothetical protein